MAEGKLLGPKLEAAIELALKKLNNVTGPGVQNYPDSIVINPPQPTPEVSPGNAAPGLDVTGTAGESVSPTSEIEFQTIGGVTPGDVNFTVVDSGDGVASISAEAVLPDCECEGGTYTQLGTTDAEEYNEDEDESADGHCVQLYVLARVAWTDLSLSDPPKLYGYYRSMTFNACGQLEAVGPEERVLVIDTEECET